MPNRRDFLKLLALTSGGLLMGGCGSSNGADVFSGGGAPNGYRFFSLMDVGKSLPDGRQLESLPGGVLINDEGKVVFYGQTAEGMGLYELEPDYEAILRGRGDRLAGARKLVSQSDMLPSGTQVQALGTIASNAGGNYALVVRNKENSRNLLFLSGGNVREVAGFRTPAAGVLLGGIFGDVDLNEQNDIMMVDHFTRPGKAEPLQGLFYIPQADLARTTILHATHDPLPEAESALTSLGLIDVNARGDYIAQVGGSALLPLGDPRLPLQGLLRGKIGESMGHHLLAGPQSFRPSLGLAAAGYTPGSVALGARLASQSDTVAHIVHQSEAQQVLFVNGVPLIKTGDASPTGSTVRSFSAPVLRSDGAVYGLLITEDGHDLVQASGAGTQVLLSRGDPVEGRRLETIAFGLHSDQVDSSGRLILVGEFADGSSAVVLGLPA